MIERLSNVTIDASTQRGPRSKQARLAGVAPLRGGFSGHPFGLGISRNPTPYGYHYGYHLAFYDCLGRGTPA
jgi:hypothetical protein